MEWPLHKLLHECTVRLMKEGSPTPVGTGFFVAPGLVLTCNHVIEPQNTAPKRLKVSYNDQAYAIKEVNPCFPREYPDLALLGIGLENHPCVYLGTTVYPDDEAYSWGYTKEHPTGEAIGHLQIAGRANYGGKVENVENPWFWKVQGSQIYNGISGAPLLNVSSGEVCGIVKSRRISEQQGLAIPTEVIFSVLVNPDLRGLQKHFHRTDKRWKIAIERHKDKTSQAYDVMFWRTPTEVLYLPKTGLLGRPDELANMDLLVAGGYAELTGMTGTGKTALAATLAFRVLSVVENKRPVLWVNAADDDENAILEGIAARLGAADAITRVKGGAKISTVRGLLETERVILIVIDDLREHRALPAIKQMVPEGAALLVTSQREIMDIKIRLGGLPPEAALELLCLTDPDNEEYRNDPAARELCRALGYHALGIKIAATWLAKRGKSPDELLERLNARTLTPSTIPLPAGYAEEGRETVKLLLDETFDDLELREAEVVKAFGALFEPKATSILLAACVKHHSKLEVEDALDELVLWNLVTRVPGTRVYFMNQMVGDYAKAAQFSNEKPDYSATVTSVLEYVKAHSQNYDLLHLDLRNILLAAETAQSTDPQALIEIMSILTIGGYPEPSPSSYLAKHGHNSQYLEQLEAAIEAADEHNAPEITRHYLYSKAGNLHRRSGQYQKAIDRYLRAIPLAPDDERKVILLGNLGSTYAETKSDRKADEYFKQGLKVAKSDNHPEALRLRALIYEQMAYVAGAIREKPEAVIRYALRNVAIYTKLNDRFGLGWSLLNLGSAQFDLRIEGSLQNHLKALEIAKSEGDVALHIRVLKGLAEQYDATGDHKQAYEYIAEAYRLATYQGWETLADEIHAWMLTNKYDVPEIPQSDEPTGDLP